MQHFEALILTDGYLVNLGKKKVFISSGLQLDEIGNNAQWNTLLKSYPLTNISLSVAQLDAING